LRCAAEYQAGAINLSTELLHGVTLSPLTMNRDNRGHLTEIYREEWYAAARPCQWNVSRTKANVLRGVHVHYKHLDHVVVIDGRLSVGLYDARPRSPTYRKAVLFEITGDRLSTLRIPVGVMHGLYAHEPTLQIYGVDAYYDVEDELQCHWADPALGIPWPCRDPELSERDKAPVSLAEAQAQLIALNPGLA
jgi:dTDP-4-dehydrorhamnose 3,5-epimerase